MNFRSSHRHHDEPEINLIPLIDVLLVMLIFFAATATFSKIGAMQVSLPTAQSSSSSDQSAELILNISADGVYQLNDYNQPINNEQDLSRALSTIKQDGSSLIIHADGQAPHQSVVSALESARNAQIEKIRFATQNANATK